jgi:hypothetical protein
VSINQLWMNFFTGPSINSSDLGSEALFKMGRLSSDDKGQTHGDCWHGGMMPFSDEVDSRLDEKQQRFTCAAGGDLLQAGGYKAELSGR